MQPEPNVEELLALAYRDDLTGLHNRRYFHRQLMKSLEQDPDPPPYSLLFLDVDFFKEVNDTYGHQAGDYVIIHVGDMLNEFVEGSEYAIRYAGDEFILFLRGADRGRGLSRAWEFVERGRAARVPWEDKEPIRFTCSIGAASFPEDGASWEEVMERADQALYQAKQLGRNRASLPPERGTGICRGDDLSRIFPCPRFFGRQEEMDWAAAKLRAWQEDGKDKPCSIVALSGPRGIGKTRFLEEVRARIPAEQARCVFFAGSEELRTFCFGSLLKGLLDHFGSADALREASQIQLSAPEEVLWESLFSNFLSDGESFDAESAARLLVRLLDALGKMHPMAILVDDAEFLDAETLRLFDLSRGLDHPPRIFVLLVHCQDAELPGLVSLQMKPLGQEAATEMVKAILPTLRADSSFFTELGATSQGNPQYLEEALKLLIHSGGLAYQRSAWRWHGENLSGLPETLEDLIRERLARLEPEVRALLEKAAVVGSEIDPELLRQIQALNEGHLLDLLDRAKRFGLLKAGARWKDETVQFLSHTAHDISYDQVPEEERIAWHLQIANLVKTSSDLPDLGRVGSLLYHSRMAGLDEELARFKNRLTVPPGPVEVFTPEKSPKKKRACSAMEDSPITPEAVARIPGVFYLTRATLQTLRLYPETSQAVSISCQRLHQGVLAMLEEAASVHFSEAEGNLLLNGEPAPWKGKDQTLAASFCTFLSEAGLKDLWFQKGLSLTEVKTFLNTWLAIARNPLSPDVSWQSFDDREDITHIRVNGRIYVALSDPSALADGLQPVSFEEAQPGSQSRASLLSSLEEQIQFLERLPPEEPSQTARMKEFLDLLKKLRAHLRAEYGQPVGAGGLPGPSSEHTEGQDPRDKADRAMESDGQALEPLPREKLDEGDVAACLSDIVSNEEHRETRGHRSLARLGERAVDSLYYLLGHSDDARAGRVCAHYLKSLAPGLEGRVRADLERNTDPQVKLRLLRHGAAVLEAKACQEILLGVLRTEEGPLAREALNLLEASSSADTSTLLLEILPVCPDRTRQEICASVGRIGDPRSVPLLIRYLERGTARWNGKADRFLEEVCHALSHYDDPQALRELARLLVPGSRWPWKTKPPPFLREAAVRALERMKRESVYAVLKRYENDRDPKVRYRVRRFLQGQT